MDSGEDGLLKKARQPVAYKPSYLKSLPGNVTTLKRKQERTAVGQTNRDQHPGPVPYSRQVSDERSMPENDKIFKHNDYKTNLVHPASRADLRGSSSPVLSGLVTASKPRKARLSASQQLSSSTLGSSATATSEKKSQQGSSAPKVTLASTLPPIFRTPLRPKLRYGRTVYPDTRHIAEPTYTEGCALYAPPAARFRTGVLDKFDTEAADTLKKRRYDFKINRRLQNEARVIETYRCEEAEFIRSQNNRALNFAFCRLKYYEGLKEIEARRDKSSKTKPLMVPPPAASMASLGGGGNTSHRTSLAEPAVQPPQRAT